MEDGLKISKDKRHRSSSSLAGVGLEGTRSERKLDLRVTIPEVEDQFAIAEARCDNLQEQIDLVKNLKRKKKIKKRSMTRLNEHKQMDNNIPLISVLTQPKKKVTVTNARFRRIDMPLNSTRSYLDPVNDQHCNVRGYNSMSRPPTEKANHSKVTQSKQSLIEVLSPVKNKSRRLREGGDSALETLGSIGRRSKNCEVACGEDETVDNGNYYNNSREAFSVKNSSAGESVHSRQQAKTGADRRKITPRENVKATKKQDLRRANEVRRQPAVNKHYSSGNPLSANKREERESRPLVELFHKSQQEDQKVQRVASADTNVSATIHEPYPRYYNKEEDFTVPPDLETTTESRYQIKGKNQQEYLRQPRRIRYRSRRYELPTVASQMKQAGMRYYYGTNNMTNIPFIVSKSTAPSHNIGVNIQQVLNGLKIQQPLSGIPFTIAHHMGLGHVPYYRKQTSAPVQPSLDAREMNAIRLGQKLVRLPSYKYMSYNRLLALYRKGEGMVPRFLRAISRPHYFYTSMYNLSTRVDFDGATSKGRGASQEAKQSLAEYAALYREYEKVDRCLKEEYEPELERRKNELSRELALREGHIRKVVQEFKTGQDTEQSTTLRASASTADESYRNSGFRINLGDHPQ